MNDIQRRISAITTCLAFALAVCAPRAFAEPVSTYRGICNASAGIDLGKGYFVVADDEMNMLFVYRYESPDYVSMIDLRDVLRDGDGKKEADLEGAARIGDRIYWIGSHSRNSEGELRPARHRLFATRIDATSATPTVKPLDAKPYDGLLKALASDKRFATLTDASTRGAEQPGGLNIEGLADTEDGGLLIGFRNPLSAKKQEAFVVKLKNPAAVVEQNAAPVFGDLVRLDLGRRGIRSIERIGAEYFIVAGPFDDGEPGAATSKFAIYKWSGVPGAAPVLWKNISPPDFHAEGLFEIGSAKQLYLLSDDGGGRSNCTRKKKPTDDKTFRGMRIDF
ncbi:DUF3616 domain-containing protein [Caballeronia insecticola]|uniref:DUF3616 domain-containing protein n=1 Tax=Caballeronia insecticola TaxID=758793 RepID=R4X1V4_9BURK|nr:DUF3616 domain-containing protein [Caballeronia insecticola]BAN26346.1 putative uncharacterized protein [Caballeronia insecticola]